jgi:hypothetical protein
MTSQNKVLTTAYLFVFLLPVFFVLHGWNEYLFFVPVNSIVTLLLVYLTGGIFCWLIFYFIYRNTAKALLAVFVSLLFYFFFGWIHDVLKALVPGTFAIKYSFLLGTLSSLYILLLLIIHKRKPATAFIFYLNALFILLIIIDVAGIAYKLITKPTLNLPPTCASCEKPDVHFIILDGFAGKDQLKEDFEFSDSSFFTDLRHQGFYVMEHSRSNYAATALSVSSVLNMDYNQLKSLEINDNLLNYCYRRISENKVTAIFKNQGYGFVNNSIFDIGDDQSVSGKTFLVSGSDLIASQTLSGRLKRDLFQNLVMQYFPESSTAKKIVFADNKNNELLYQRLTPLVKKFKQPVFSYTHLMMPHFPYYYKEDGSLNAMKDLLPANLNRKDLYIGYLKYTGTKISRLTDDLIRNGKKNTVIILISDHGYRYTGNKKLYYSTLGAVYRSDRNYSMYHDSVSNVNQFRILFNSLFRYKDSLLTSKEF